MYKVPGMLSGTWQTALLNKCQFPVFLSQGSKWESGADGFSFGTFLSPKIEVARDSKLALSLLKTFKLSLG